MSHTDQERYARQRALPGFGAPAQSRLSSARVLVIGAGGLGSAVLPLLAASGVGTIGVVDDDRVELSNLHRQHIHGTADVGRSKVHSAADTLAALNPNTTVVPIEERLTSENALRLFAEYDLVVDGSDNFPTRYLANDAAALTGIPVVWGAVSQYSGQSGVAWAARGPDYRDLFPAPPQPGAVLSCAEGGVLPTVCSVIGSLMATDVIKLITGVGSPLLGRVVTFDGLSGEFRELSYERDPDAEPVTHLVDYDLFCGLTRAGSGGAENGSPREVTAPQLAAELDSGADLTLLDVREQWEAEIVSLPGAVLVPLSRLDTALNELDTSRPIVVYCHLGVRSERALALLEDAGIRGARHLAGGIESWSRSVDPAAARY